VPVARYLMFVGCTLVALLFIAEWCLPVPSSMFADRSVAVDRAVIRIKSAHKWPEKIVLDTTLPTIAAPSVGESPAVQSVRLPPDEAGDKSNFEVLAQLKPVTPLVAADHPTLRLKRGLARIPRSRRVAGAPVARRMVRAEAGGGCCQFGWIENGQTSSIAASRRHAASSWPMDWPALTGRN
jgi:hypothetical protein